MFVHTGCKHPDNVYVAKFELESAGYHAGSSFSIKKNDQEVFTNTVSGNCRGLNVAIFDAVTSELTQVGQFDTSESDAAADQFAEFIENAAIGDIVTIAACDDANYKLNYRAKNACKMVGSQLIDKLRYRDSWALIGIKGVRPGTAVEKVDASVRVKISSLVRLQPDWQFGLRITARSAGFHAGNFAEISVNGKAVSIPGDVYNRGLNVVAFDGKSGKVLHSVFYDTYASPSRAEMFASMVDSLPDGAVVAIAIKDEGTVSLGHNGRAACESLGSGLIQCAKFRDSWAIVGVKGVSSGSVPEVLSGHTTAQATLWLPTAFNPDNFKGCSVVVQSSGLGKGAKSEIIVNGVPTQQQYLRGITVSVVNKKCAVERSRTFDTYVSAKQAQQLATMINGIPKGTLVMATIWDEGTQQLTEEAKEALESIGSALIHNVGFRESWGIIGRKGVSPGSVPEIMDRRGTIAMHAWVSPSGTGDAESTIPLRCMLDLEDPKCVCVAK